MSDRIIFTVRKNGKVIAYLFESWGMGMGPAIERQFKQCAKRDNLDVVNSQEDCLLALVRAGEELWGKGSGEFNGQEKLTDNYKTFKVATRLDRKWMKDHKAFVKEHGLDVRPQNASFFYGVSEDYVKYIYSWCEDSHELDIDTMLPDAPLSDSEVKEFIKFLREWFILNKPAMDPYHLKFTVKDNRIYFRNKNYFCGRIGWHWISRKGNRWALNGKPHDSIERGLTYYM